MSMSGQASSSSIDRLIASWRSLAVASAARGFDARQTTATGIEASWRRTGLSGGRLGRASALAQSLL